MDMGDMGIDTPSAPGGGSDKRSGLISVNDLTYVLEPDLSVATNKTHKKHFFQTNQFDPSQRAICILNSGADYIDTRRSYLSFEVTLSETNRMGYFGQCGSACNFIRSIQISTRSGDTLCRLDDFASLSNILLPLMYDREWFDNQGALMSFGGAVHRYVGGAGGAVQNANGTGEGDSQRFVIPMYVLSPLFAYGRLLPAMMMSGLRIEIEWQTAAKAFQTVDASAPATRLWDPLTTYTVKTPYFVLESVQLSDSIQRALNEQSAVNGLEIVYCDYEMTEAQASGLESKWNIEVRKSCSRALKAFARFRAVDQDTKEGLTDTFKAETQWPVTSYQWQLGSLYFPQQPVKSASVDAPMQCCREAYAHLLETVDKFHGASSQPYMTYAGRDAQIDWTKTGRVLATDTLQYTNVFANSVYATGESAKTYLYDVNGRQPLVTSATDTANGRLIVKSNPFGRSGSFAGDQHVIGVNLERSSLFNLAGVPVNNSRVLALQATCVTTTGEGVYGKDNTTKATVDASGVSAIDAVSTSARRSCQIFLKYVKLARIWLNNVEVEQ